MDDLDAYRCANLLLQVSGLGAALDRAAERRRELHAAGDHAGVQAWDRIGVAVLELTRTHPSLGETMH